jgi:hypothetical protein
LRAEYIGSRLAQVAKINLNCSTGQLGKNFLQRNRDRQITYIGLLYTGLQFQRQVLENALQWYVDRFGLLRGSSSAWLGGVREGAAHRRLHRLRLNRNRWFSIRLRLDGSLAFGQSLRLFAQQIFKKAKHIWFVSG